MSINASKTGEFVGDVEKITLDSIRPSEQNPRGTIEKNENYLRLVSSISDVGVLVPIVVRELPHPRGAVKYELVDGERRYWAAKECGREEVPAHILRASNTLGDLRKLMFHTHMTREEWSAVAQCRALTAVYPKLADGVRFSEKVAWTKKLAKETLMGMSTARDRIHFLSWPGSLKDRIYTFEEKHNSKDIYSYVLAIEVSVVEQSIGVFPDYYNHDQPPEKAANKVRASLLDKTITGLDTGLVSSREQIRGISPLFVTDLEPAKRRIALGLFKQFVGKPELQFDDLRAEIGAQLPEALKEKPPKPQRVIALLRSLDRILRDYDPGYINDSLVRESARDKLKSDFVNALDGVASAIKTLRARF